MGIPSVLNALSIIVDSMEISGDKEGRLAIDLPEEYDWDRINDFFAQLSTDELVDFCKCCLNKSIGEAMLQDYKKDYGEEAEYAEEALDALVKKLKEGEPKKKKR
jgi:uncharacterized protein (DUF3820 family)